MSGDGNDRAVLGGPLVLGIALVVQVVVLLVFADTERKSLLKQAQITSELRMQLAQGYLIQERLVARLESREPRQQPQTAK